MPYTVRYLPNKKCYSVRRKRKVKVKGKGKGKGKDKGKQKIFSKCTTRKKAYKQLKLLRAIERNPKYFLGIRRKTKRNNKSK
mgnify:CR=1 FL=1